MDKERRADTIQNLHNFKLFAIPKTIHLKRIIKNEAKEVIRGGNQNNSGSWCFLQRLGPHVGTDTAAPVGPPRVGKASSLAPCHGAPLATSKPLDSFFLALFCWWS
jgi:hypothetical protein